MGIAHEVTPVAAPDEKVVAAAGAVGQRGGVTDNDVEPRISEEHIVATGGPYTTDGPGVAIDVIGAPEAENRIVAADLP
jgi:hypothetical protein